MRLIGGILRFAILHAAHISRMMPRGLRVVWPQPVATVMTLPLEEELSEAGPERDIESNLRNKTAYKKALEFVHLYPETILIPSD